MKPEPVPPRTVAIVLAAGLGTRMKSRLPKVLHDLCGRPMLGYVIEARPGARPAPVRSSSYSPATGDRPRGLRRGRRLRPPGRAAGHRRRGRGGARRAAGRRARGPRRLRGRAAPRGRAARGAPRRATGPTGAALSLVSVVTIDPGRLGTGRPGRGRRGRPDRRGARRVRGRARDRRDQRRDLRLRRGLAAPADRRPPPVAGHRRAVPDRARRARPGRRTPGRHRRGRRRRDARSGSTTGRSSPTRPTACANGSTSGTCSPG